MPECKIFNVKINVEIPIFLFYFAYSLSEPIITNLIIFRTCYVTLGYNKSDCVLLGSKNITNATVDLETLTQPSAAIVSMVQNTINASIFAILCMFMGPWTDKFGRKPMLILPIIGYTAYFILLLIFALLENVSPWYSLLCSVPMLLIGGAASYLTAVLCYITDVSSEKARGMKMSVLETATAVGILLGNISSSYMLAATNYPTVFAICASCGCLIIVFTVFFMPESLKTRVETEGRFRGFFRLSYFCDMLKTTMKKRLNYDRFIVLSCALIVSLFILAHTGESGLTFLFLRKKFSWSLEQFTIFSAINHVFSILATMSGTYFLHDKLKISETVVILVGLISVFAGMVYFGFASYNWDIYFAAIIGSLGGVVKPMVRSLISKIVPNEEVGKIFPLIIVGDWLIGKGGAGVFTAIYNATINIDPGIFFFVSAGIFLFEIIIAIGIIFAKKSSQPINYSFTNEDQQMNDMII